MSFTLQELAERVGGELDGPADLVISGVAGLEEAAAGELSFLARARYRPQLRETTASAVIVKPKEDCALPAIRVQDPQLAFLVALEAFARLRDDLFEAGVHPTAVIHPSARTGADVRIGPHVSIGAGCRVGRGTTLGANCVLMPESSVGEDSLLYPGVIVREDCELGDRVIVHSGAVIGADGFGFARPGARYRKIPQIGRVIVEDDVEIGANTCIDRATTGRTVIGAGTKLDNLVQIAHNVTIGENTAISAQTGISGSTKIGSDVVLAGQVGIVDHAVVGDGVQVGGQSGISGRVPDGSMVSGSPAVDHKLWRRQNVHLARIADYAQEITRLRKRLEKLEKAQGAETAEND